LYFVPSNRVILTQNSKENAPFSTNVIYTYAYMSICIHMHICMCIYAYILFSTVTITQFKKKKQTTKYEQEKNASKVIVNLCIQSFASYTIKQQQTHLPDYQN